LIVIDNDKNDHPENHLLVAKKSMEDHHLTIPTIMVSMDDGNSLK